MAVDTIALRTRLLCGTALTLMATSPVLAQEDFSNAHTLDPILVRRADPLGDAADRATAVYVADAEVERAALGNLKDLFAGIASVSVGGAIPVAQKIYVNGVDMLNLAIQVDGVSQNNRVFHHASANAFDPGLLKSVRVDPGVAPADAGPRALAGRVVMETVDAGDILEEGQSFGGMSRLGYADNGDLAQGSLTLATRNQGFEFLAYGKRATGDNYEDGDGNLVTGTETSIKAGLLKFAYESDEGHRLEFSGQKFSDVGLRNRRANFGTAPWNPLSNVYDTERSIFSLRYENTHGTGMWDPAFTLGYSESDVSSIGASETARGVSDTLSLVLKNTFHLSDVNTIVAGVDYQERKSAASGDYWSNTPTLADEPFEESENIGIFAQARLEPTDRLKVSAGVRYDWQDFTGQDATMTGSPFETSNSGASANLSLVFDVTEELSVRAGYSNVYGGVALEDNFLFYQAFDYSELKDSRAENYVIGADWHGGNWTVGGEVFRTKIKDGRNFVLGNNATVALADFESRGFNLGATYGWNTGFARFTFSKSDNYLDGKIASTTNLVDYGTPLGEVLALEVQQEIPSMNLLVGGNIEAALSHTHGADDLPAGWASPVSMDSYEVLNLFAEYTPPSFSNVKIRAEVKNVFDETYADRATYGSDSSEVVTLKEPGRTFALVATVRF